MIRISGLSLDFEHTEKQLYAAAATRIGLVNIIILHIRRRSIDARRGRVWFVYTVDVEVEAEEQRRRHEQAELEATADANEAEVASWSTATIPISVIVVSVVLTALAGHVQLLWLLGPSLGVVGALSAIWPLWLKRRAQRREIQPGYLACGIATAIMSTFALHFAVAAMAVGSWLFALAMHR